LVVLAEEDERGVVDGGPDETLVDVALRSRAVAEVADGGFAVVVADLALEPLAHRVTGGVEHLVADHDAVRVEAVGLVVPAAVVGAAEDAEQLAEVDAARVRDAVLAVAGEGHVTGLERAAGADLRGFLAEQRDPDAELALPLHRVGLAVRATDEHHVAVEPAQRLVVDVGDIAVELWRGDPFAFGGEQLRQLSSTFTGRSQTGDHLLGGGLGRYGCGAISGLRVRPLFGRHALYSLMSAPLAAACGDLSDCTVGDQRVGSEALGHRRR